MYLLCLINLLLNLCNLYCSFNNREYGGNHRSLGYEHAYEPRMGSLSDRGASQPSSPGMRQLQQNPQMPGETQSVNPGR